MYDVKFFIHYFFSENIFIIKVCYSLSHIPINYTLKPKYIIKKYDGDKK